jgi:hypothetical protein
MPVGRFVRRRAERSTFGIAPGMHGELSRVNRVFPRVLFLIPLLSFAGFIWLIAAGILLPRIFAPNSGRVATERAAF